MVLLDVLTIIRIYYIGSQGTPSGPCKVPIELKDKLQAELCEMERQDIIARVTQPTDWVNFPVIREKENGRLR